ncbi:MAG: restriction endonuclease subunit S [Gammaproteobacteria bacterium]|nr:MAG: restriction endonuclease subunit S [Gammaproteobacteria bacterium]
MDYVDDFLFEGLHLLIAEDGSVESPDGKPFLQLVDGQFWVNNHAHVLRATNEDETRFIYYALSNIAIRPYMSGSVQAKLNQANLNRIAISYPPNEKDRYAIAQILGTLDDKIELNRQMNHTLEAMAQALFKSWFVDFDPVVVNALRAGNTVPEKFAQRAAHYRDNPDALRLPEDTLRQFPDRFQESELGAIPEGWDVQSLDDIATFLNGLACQKYPAAPGEPSLPAIKIRELRQGISRNTDRVTIHVPEKYILHDGDVLFSWSGSLLIDIWTQGKGVLNQHVFKVISENHPKWFYFHWLDFHLLEFKRIAADKATTMGHIKRHHLADAKVVVPDSDIMKLASYHVSPISNNKIENAIQARSLAKLRDTLLPKLISGELRVPDAEKLLEDVS